MCRWYYSFSIVDTLASVMLGYSGSFIYKIIIIFLILIMRPLLSCDILWHLSALVYFQPGVNCAKWHVIQHIDNGGHCDSNDCTRKLNTAPHYFSIFLISPAISWQMDVRIKRSTFRICTPLSRLSPSLVSFRGFLMYAENLANTSMPAALDSGCLGASLG